ncbi:MAG: hypothetical protein ACI8T1_001281 [Verrucomicrobiales bacterium]|jgi:hypothetical protein
MTILECRSAKGGRGIDADGTFIDVSDRPREDCAVSRFPAVGGVDDARPFCFRRNLYIEPVKVDAEFRVLNDSRETPLIRRIRRCREEGGLIRLIEPIGKIRPLVGINIFLNDVALWICK